MPRAAENQSNVVDTQSILLMRRTPGSRKTADETFRLARCWSPAMSSFIAVAIAKKLAIVSIRRDEWIRLPAQMV